MTKKIYLSLFLCSGLFIPKETLPKETLPMEPEFYLVGGMLVLAGIGGAAKFIEKNGIIGAVTLTTMLVGLTSLVFATEYFFRQTDANLIKEVDSLINQIKSIVDNNLGKFAESKLTEDKELFLFFAAKYAWDKDKTMYHDFLYDNIVKINTCMRKLNLRINNKSIEIKNKNKMLSLYSKANEVEKGLNEIISYIKEDIAFFELFKVISNIEQNIASESYNSNSQIENDIDELIKYKQRAVTSPYSKLLSKADNLLTKLQSLRSKKIYHI
jgi:hypothetical protein